MPPSNNVYASPCFVPRSLATINSGCGYKAVEGSSKEEAAVAAAAEDDDDRLELSIDEGIVGPVNENT